MSAALSTLDDMSSELGFAAVDDAASLDTTARIEDEVRLDLRIQVICAGLATTAAVTLATSGVVPETEPLWAAETVEFQDVGESKRDALVAHLKQFRFYEDGWAGPDSLGPSKDVVTRARQMAESLPAEVSLPRAAIAADGEISLFWESDEYFADVTFAADGTYSYYVRRKAEKFFGDDIPISEGWSAELLSLLPRVS